MKKILLLLTIILMAFGNASAFVDSYTIDRDKLPAEAKEMLSEHFPKSKISMIKVDRAILKKTEYEVKLVNGTVIRFANSGKWKSVDCKKRELPVSLLPKTVARHIEKNFPEAKVTSVVKKNGGYEVTHADETLHRYDLLGIYKGQ